MLLTQEERDKFAAWCRQEAASNDALAIQLGAFGDATAPLVKQKRIESMACSVVAKVLESIEDQTISGAPTT